MAITYVAVTLGPDMEFGFYFPIDLDKPGVQADFSFFENMDKRGIVEIIYQGSDEDEAKSRIGKLGTYNDLKMDYPEWNLDVLVLSVLEEFSLKSISNGTPK